MSEEQLSTYQILLQHEKWQSKREEILKRDNYKCQKCSNRTYFDDDSISVYPIKRKGTNEKGHYVVIETSQYADDTIVNYVRLSMIDWPTGPLLSCVFDDKVTGVISFPEKISASSAQKLVQDLVKNITKGYSEIDWKKFLIGREWLYNWPYVRGIQVHHTYYKYNKLPWQYPNESLMTVCGPCHQKIHEEETIYVEFDDGNKIELTPCDRCDGTGYISRYSHYKNGVCFKCFGGRFDQKLMDDNTEV